MPKILALGDQGIIAIGRRLRDEELAKHDLIPLNGEEAVHIPQEVIERYLAAVLEQMGIEAAAHDVQHIAQQGGTSEETQA